jgi:hypothetical protein
VIAILTSCLRNETRSKGRACCDEGENALRVIGFGNIFFLLRLPKNCDEGLHRRYVLLRDETRLAALATAIVHETEHFFVWVKVMKKALGERTEVEARTEDGGYMKTSLLCMSADELPMKC